MSKDITPDGSFCPVFLEPTDPIQVAADQAADDTRKAAKDKAVKAQAAAKKSAQTKLAALGLTADEIAAL